MKESLDLHQNQQLTQRLSPRQVQFVRLLEMTAPEIEEEVRRQLDDNPALEAIDGLDPAVPELGEVEESSDSTEHSENASQPDVPEYEDSEDDPAERASIYSNGSEGQDIASWQVADEEIDLLTALTAQLRQTNLPERTLKIAIYIAGNLDENGYLTRTLAAMADDIAITTGQEIDLPEMRAAFEALRQLDPAGIGAVDLRDCLLLQLKRIEPNSLTLKIAKEIVSDYFDLLSKKHFERLQAQLDLDDDNELKLALQLIRRLDPKPGLALNPGGLAQRMSHISPDVAVDISEDGHATVSLVSRLPQLQVEQSFNLSSDSKPRNKGEREAQTFVRLKRDDAEAFISAIKQRGSTLLTVAQAIVKRQSQFFLTGDKSAIRPMVLKDIAADTGLDMSVISRATAGKYIASSLGTYPLKMFFNEAAASNTDEELSAHQVAQALQHIIDSEDKKHPLSDRAIQIEMADKGFPLARRTVTKYREKLGIPVGRLRKKI